VRTSTARTTTTLTATEAALLGVLALNGPLSGYDVRKAVDNGVGYFWAPAKTQIYTVLPRLVEAGFATREQVEQTDRPDKQVYEVTAAGRAAVTAWLEAAPTPGGDRSPFLLRVFLGALASQEALVRHVRAQRDEAESLRDDLEQRDAQSDGAPKDFHAALTRRYGLAYARAMIDWANEVERKLDA
jgi:PadR family transcriptional regulator AphA